MGRYSSLNCKTENLVELPAKAGESSLVSKNITIFEKRTSIRLEPEMWESLYLIAEREGCAIHDICTLIAYRKKESTSLTAAIRVFIMLYYKAAATEDGHVVAGHGCFSLMQRRARVSGEALAFFQRIRQVGRSVRRAEERL